MAEKRIPSSNGSETLNRIGRNDGDNAFNSSGVVANADGSVFERLEYIQVAIGGAAGQLRTIQSISGTVEEAALMQFTISLMDIDSGAIASANIDITSISAVMERSRAGAAFSAMTSPSFSKADGQVYCTYEFLAAEWQTGDIYRLTVTGITCTIGTSTAYVPATVWSNLVVEQGDLHAAIADIQTDIGDPSSRSNLQSLEAMLGNPDTAGKTVYEAVKNLRETAIDGSSTPTANTLSDILHKDGSYTFDNTTDSLEAISDKITDVNTDIGDFSARTNLQSLLGSLGIPDVAGKDLYTCLITDRLDNGTYGLSALETLVDDLETELAKVPKSDSTVSWNATALQAIQDEAEDALEGENLDHLIQDAVDTDLATTVDDASVVGYLITKTGVASFDRTLHSLEALYDLQVGSVAAANRVAGKDQIFTKEITSAADAGDVTLATVTTQPILLESVTIHSDGATTADLTSIGIYCGASKVVEILSTTQGAQANIDAQDKQISSEVEVYLPTGATIVATLAGTGSTTVDLNAVIKFKATVNGGYLV